MDPRPTVTLVPGRLDLGGLRRLAEADCTVVLDPGCWPAIDAAAAVVQAVLDEGRVAYGINTGFGSLARTRISTEAVTELQRRLVLSHTVGVGPLLSDQIVRLILLLKINSLARGHSGVRRPVIELLLALLNRGAYPTVPAKGSVGASGDLAPLAHLSCALIGEGEIRLAGEPPSLTDAVSGCIFHTRCPRKLSSGICETTEPDLLEGEPGHLIRCHIPISELRHLQGRQGVPVELSPRRGHP